MAPIYFPDDYEAFIRDRIRSLLIVNNISDREFSNLLGKSPCYIRDVLSGRTLPSMKAFKEICFYLHISPKDFFDIDYKHLSSNTKIISRLVYLLGDDIKKMPELLDKFSREDVEAIIKMYRKLVMQKE